MHISVSDYDLMAQDAAYLIHCGTAFQPAVDTIAAENKLNQDQRNILNGFTAETLNALMEA